MHSNIVIVMVPALHQCESATDARVPPSWTPPAILPTPSLWVVPEHQLWVLCFMHQIFTGHLFFLLLSFKPAFPLSSFTFIKRLFSSSSFCAITVVSSAYLRLLIFLWAILTPACESSSPAFLMYSAYKLNKQGDNIQAWHIAFPILIQAVVSCTVLSIPSYPAYRFLRRQVRWSGIPISSEYSTEYLWWSI